MRFTPPPETDDWLEDLRAFARAHRRLLSDRAWAVAPIFTNPSPGPAAVRIGELAMAILVRGGLSTRETVAAWGQYGSDDDYELVLEAFLRVLQERAQGPTPPTRPIE